jgi:hypothetical protein
MLLASDAVLFNHYLLTAMTITAAPYRLISRAFLIKSSSPSFKLILLTMHRPCEHLKHASITSKLDESIINGNYIGNKYT